MKDIDIRIKREHTLMTVSVITIVIVAIALVIVFIFTLSGLGVVEFPDYFKKLLGLKSTSSEIELDSPVGFDVILKEDVLSESSGAILELGSADPEKILDEIVAPYEYTLRERVYLFGDGGVEQQYSVVLYCQGNLCRNEVRNGMKSDSEQLTVLLSDGKHAECLDFSTDESDSYKPSEFSQIKYECRPALVSFLFASDDVIKHEVSVFRTQSDNVLFLTVKYDSGLEERCYISIEDGIVTERAIYRDGELVSRTELVSFAEGISDYSGNKDVMFSDFR